MRASDLIKVAEKELGYTEKKNNDTKYGIAYGMNNVYWCMIFVWWCFNQLDKSLFYDGKKCASCSQLMNWAKSKGQWVTKSYQPGDVLIYKWPKSKNAADHCGICTAANTSDVFSIEGNTSSGTHGSQDNGDGVYRRVRPLAYVVGACRPKYEESYRSILQRRAGLENATMDYLEKYKYGSDLIRKLATMK